MLKVVESATQVNDRGGVVVVESDCDGPPFTAAFAELEGPEAVRLAQSYAARFGCAPSAVNGNRVGPYPVNSAGVPIEDVRDPDGNPLPVQHPLMQPYRYRVDIRLVGRLLP